MPSKKFFLSLFLITLNVMGFSECFDCFNFSVGGEALWWQPCNEPFHYGEFSDDQVLDRQLLLNTKYEWGFRVFGNIADKNCCRFIDVEWAHVKGKTKETKNVGDEPGLLDAFPFIQDVGVGNASSITAFQRTRYDKVSGKAGARLCGDCYASLYGYIGGRWVRFEVEKSSEWDSLESVPEITRVNWCTEFNAGAFEVGLGARATVFSCLDASIRFGGIAAIGKRNHEFHQSNGQLRNNTTPSHLCTGGFEVRGDLGFTIKCRCWWIRVAGGYELDYYFKTLLRHQPTVQSTNIIAEDFGIGGPFVGATLGF